MFRLNQTQISLIEADVESARITLSHLSHELVDHICCEVEEQMEHGKSFDEAYSSIKEQTGIQTLKNIQENTLTLINKNYAFMKTTMKVTGNVSLALLGIGTLLKVIHLPGASVILVLGFALLALIFFPSAIYLNYTHTKNKSNLLLTLSILIGGIALMAGILFKVMHWQGANILLLLGWLFILALFLPMLLSAKVQEAQTTKEKWIYALGIVALMIFETSTMFKFFHWPGAAPLMFVGSVLLVSVFLPFYTYMKFKEDGKISGQYIFIIILSLYMIALTALLAVNSPAPKTDDVYKQEFNKELLVDTTDKN